MNVADIRSKFINFFVANGHTHVASSPLVPGNDPTLLFTNSGMVQFKDVFLGQEQRPYKRATTSQRCVRAGGKHNDLENVGYTARHHTFFEMLGNFSFGDYFKRDAIRLAWELLTKQYGLAPERLWTTVYVDDDEAFDIWTKEIGVPAERCIRIGDNKGAAYASDNFWQMADTGPCGPCSEIFYDHGPDVSGGPPGSPDAEGDRYIEIWNLVFMQFNRDAAGTMTPLPKPCVDTGMGLERLAAVLQHVHSNYEIDLFVALIKAAASATHTKDLDSPSLKVIADHIRACAFLIVDGVIPGSEGRGYVLRRIIRRAIRHGYQLGQRKPFFHTLVEELDRQMGAAYPELTRDKARVAQVLKAEEERFGETIEHGMRALEDHLDVRRRVVDAYESKIVGLKPYEAIFPGGSVGEAGFQSRSGQVNRTTHVRVIDCASPQFSSDAEINHVKGLIERSKNADTKNGETRTILVVSTSSPDHIAFANRLRNLISDPAVGESITVDVVSSSDVPLSGRVVFQLYDTYGFPSDLTADVARERNVRIDMEGFDRLMDAQRSVRAQRASSRWATRSPTTARRRAFAAMRRCPPKAASSRCTRTVRRWNRCRPASAASSCWTRRRSTRNPAARLAIAASSARGARA